MFEYNRISIGRRIKNLRNEMGLTLKEFSEFLDIPLTSINSWERGISIPSPQYLQKLSDKVGKEIRWILYGDIEEYVEDIFDYFELNEIISCEDFTELVNELKNSNFTPGDYKTFRDIGRLVITNLDELIETKEVEQEEKSLSPQKLVNEFPILKKYEVQNEYLVMLQSLLTGDDKDENGQSILFLMDTLSRMNDKSKPLFKRLLRDLNWLVTNNLFLLDREHQSEKASFGGIMSAKSYDQQKERDWSVIEKDMKKIIADIETRMKSIVELNYEEFKKNKHKTIF